MGEFNSFMKKGDSQMITPPLSLLIILDVAAIHIGISDLLSNVKSNNDIWKDIEIGLRCRKQ